MDRKHNIPNDLAECQRLLLAAFKQTVQLEQQAAVSQQRVAELDRVLDATSDSFQKLREEHVTTLEELAWYKRWVHGRRRERIGRLLGACATEVLRCAEELPKLRKSHWSRSPDAQSEIGMYHFGRVPKSAFCTQETSQINLVFCFGARQRGRFRDLENIDRAVVV